jgi:hypothetical protein
MSVSLTVNLSSNPRSWCCHVSKQIGDVASNFRLGFSLAGATAISPNTTQAPVSLSGMNPVLEISNETSKMLSESITEGDETTTLGRIIKAKAGTPIRVAAPSTNSSILRSVCFSSGICVSSGGGVLGVVLRCSPLRTLRAIMQFTQNHPRNEKRSYRPQSRAQVEIVPEMRHDDVRVQQDTTSLVHRLFRSLRRSSARGRQPLAARARRQSEPKSPDVLPRQSSFCPVASARAGARSQPPIPAWPVAAPSDPQRCFRENSQL